MQALRETDPRHIGPYRVLGRLGAGGMGEVYLAEAPGGPRLAVKVVRAEYAEDRTFRARFRQEVGAARSVGGSGSYVARVVDADTEGERPWMATEFIDGPNLRDAVLEHGALPVEPVWVLAAALGEALGAIHAHGLVHRDLKPSNILLAADGPRVIDFGVVRALEATALTRTGTVVGSAGYLSPEQIRTHGRVGPSSDVFSLGAVLAYAAAGRDPFGEGQDAVILMRVVARDFDLSGVPEAVRPLVEACLREDPAERPTPAEVVEATGYAARSLPGRLRPGWFTAAEPVRGTERWLPERGAGEGDSRVEYVAPLTLPDGPAPRTPSRRRLLQGLVAGALVAGAGTGGWLWLRDGDSRGGGTQSGPGAATSTRSTPPPPQPAVVEWAYGTSEIAEDGGPCVGLSPDGRLVCFGGVDGRLHAVTWDGRARWYPDLGDPPLGGGVVGTPVVTRDGAYCLHEFGSRFFALDLKGRVRWKRVFDKDRYGALPVATDFLVILTTSPSADQAAMRAYRPDGSLAWSTRLPDQAADPPVVADSVVYINTSRKLTALAAGDGTRLWTREFDNDFPGRPALVGETLVVPAAQAAYGLSRTGEILWQRANTDLDDPETFVAFGDLAIATCPGRLVAVDPRDGSTAWTVRGPGDLDRYSDPTVHDSLAYVFLGHSTLYVVDGSGAQTRRLTFPDDSLMAEYRPVIGPHPRQGLHMYVATSNGIAAVSLTD
ncbi:protein kinase domain-containing protein [Streptomyces justiciae]|uniref:protein kinase domain-containing protein n=1 Tax=Streptomyces justiciae TaxID=2780140 RepID=UPI001880F0CE|nr:PQQ-binding-like beta-propeller repeat protein [Streptomyces justiciae]MBE8474743.1 PQQ-binding-like beta-propeller repeat protein [Streptomyces justiciae]